MSALPPTQHRHTRGVGGADGTKDKKEKIKRQTRQLPNIQTKHARGNTTAAASRLRAGNISQPHRPERNTKRTLQYRIVSSDSLLHNRCTGGDAALLSCAVGGAPSLGRKEGRRAFEPLFQTVRAFPAAPDGAVRCVRDNMPSLNKLAPTTAVLHFRLPLPHKRILPASPRPH